VLALISGAGVSIRHFFNRRHKGQPAWQYPLVGAALLGIAAWWTAPRIIPLPKVEGPVTFERVRSILGERCINCHSPIPTFPGLPGPPAGVLLHLPDGVLKNAQRIYQQVIVTRMMPLGNLTRMTEQERAVIAAWVADGATMK
jgi:uncharacterized membrane protein